MTEEYIPFDRPDVGEEEIEAVLQERQADLQGRPAPPEEAGRAPVPQHPGPHSRQRRFTPPPEPATIPR